ncbi:hypothetical protein B0H10DRAFT_785948 [Mycena sp. CBHHK59/15]|nr:hypothetical protein B0H10DRAFT_785948 [Mycena sp. CBHHK59/15]
MRVHTLGSGSGSGSGVGNGQNGDMEDRGRDSNRLAPARTPMSTSNTSEMRTYQSKRRRETEQLFAPLSPEPEVPQQPKAPQMAPKVRPAHELFTPSRSPSPEGLFTPPPPPSAASSSVIALSPSAPRLALPVPRVLSPAPLPTRKRRVFMQDVLLPRIKRARLHGDAGGRERERVMGRDREKERERAPSTATSAKMIRVYGRGRERSESTSRSVRVYGRSERERSVSVPVPRERKRIKSKSSGVEAEGTAHAARQRVVQG